MGRRATRLKIEIEIALADERNVELFVIGVKKIETKNRVDGKGRWKREKLFIFIKAICKKDLKSTERI